MLTFVMLTRISPGTLHTPAALEDLEKRVKERIRSECEDIEWIQNYAVLGPYDYVDIFHAPDIENAIKVTTIVRSFGHAHTELWPATEWSYFKEIIRDLEAPEAEQA